MNDLNQAITLAVQAHAGLVDRAGQPYILHVLRVGAAGKTEEERLLGFLHDIIEDTYLSPTVLQSKFSAEIMQALAAITREPGESYRAYIERVATNSLARAVKLYDLHDNLSRMPQIVEMEGLRNRYLKALEQLGEK